MLCGSGAIEDGAGFFAQRARLGVADDADDLVGDAAAGLRAGRAALPPREDALSEGAMDDGVRTAVLDLWQSQP